MLHEAVELVYSRRLSHELFSYNLVGHWCVVTSSFNFTLEMTCCISSLVSHLYANTIFYSLHKGSPPLWLDWRHPWVPPWVSTTVWCFCFPHSTFPLSAVATLASHSRSHSAVTSTTPPFPPSLTTLARYHRNSSWIIPLLGWCFSRICSSIFSSNTGTFCKLYSTVTLKGIWVFF